MKQKEERKVAGLNDKVEMAKVRPANLGNNQEN